MKKLLALVLAMVMTLGLSAVSANAVDKFADNDSIKYTEAATVMKAIGVFDGDDSGNFRPTETLKRSEAAKIVAYLMLTKKTADGLVPSGTRYVDVPANHWAAGYIEYLTSEGVLGGVGNGMFNPDGDITGIDFAKMLLVALGYDAKLENLVLSDYRINTAKLANNIDLFEGNTDMVPTAAITRDEAVLYAFNMIRSPMREYDSNVRVDSGNGSVVTVGNNRAYEKTSSNSSKQTISRKHASRNDQYSSSSSAPWMVEFAEEKYPDLKLVDVSENNEKGIGADAFGRPSRKWLYKNVDLGRFNMTGDLVATWSDKATAKRVYDQLGKTVYDSLKDHNSDLDVWLDGIHLIDSDYDAIDASVVNAYMNRDNTTKINGSGNGTITELYMDKDKNVTIVTMNVYVFQAAADYNKNSKTLRVTTAGETSDTFKGTLASMELKLEDFPEIENYKIDDFLLAKVAWSGSNNVYDLKEVEKAEIVSGKVDSYTTDGTYSVTIDGTKHNYAVTAENKDNDDSTRKTMYSVGKDAKVVTDKYGYIYAVDEAIVTSDYVFITKFGSNSNLKSDAVAAAYFTDGTDGTIKVKSVYNYGGDSSVALGKQVTSKSTIGSWTENSAGAAVQANKWYTYSKNASNEYTLYGPQSGRDWTSKSFTFDASTGAQNIVLYDGQVRFLYGNNKLSADDKTIVVVNDDAKSKVDVYTGVKNVPGISLTNAKSTAGVYALYKTSNNVATVVYVDLKGDALVTGSANDNLIYIIKSDGSIRTNDDKNETRWQYKVLKNDGTKDTENIIADNQVSSYTNQYMIANYASKNADGVYTRFYNVSDSMAKSDTVAWGTASATEADYFGDKFAMNESNAPVSYKNGALQIGNHGWTLADDAKITVVGIKTDAGNAINTDKAADEEVHAWISGNELNGMFNNLDSYTYDYALRTTGSLSSNGLANSGRTTVKELFITVWDATVGTGTTPVVTTGLSAYIDNGNVIRVYTTEDELTKSSALYYIDYYLEDVEGYTVTNKTAAGDTYTYTTKDANGFAQTLTYNFDDEKVEDAVVLDLDADLSEVALSALVAAGGKLNAYVAKQDGMKLTVAAGRYLAVDGKVYGPKETVTVGIRSIIAGYDIKVTVDGAETYLKAVTAGKYDVSDYVSKVGTGWLHTTADGTVSEYVAYADADTAAEALALNADDVLTSGYVKITLATAGDDAVTYTKANNAVTLKTNVETAGMYNVLVGKDKTVAATVEVKDVDDQATVSLSALSVTGDISLQMLNKITVDLSAAGISLFNVTGQVGSGSPVSAVNNAITLWANAKDTVKVNVTPRTADLSTLNGQLAGGDKTLKLTGNSVNLTMPTYEGFTPSTVGNGTVTVAQNTTLTNASKVVFSGTVGDDVTATPITLTLTLDGLTPNP